MNQPIIALTMGDPAGIGPEIIMKALASPDVRAICRPLVVGDAERLRVAGKIVDSRLHVESLDDASEASYGHGDVECIDLDLVPEDLPFGAVSPVAGEAAFRYIERAVRIVEAGAARAICTAPLSKEALHAAGHKYPGHTELLAALTRTPAKTGCSAAAKKPPRSSRRSAMRVRGAGTYAVHCPRIPCSSWRRAATTTSLWPCITTRAMAPSRSWDSSPA